MTFSSIRVAGSAVALLALAAGSVPQAANAHALLQSAEPSVGGSVAGSPSTIVLEFSEGVEARYSHVSVTGPGGASRCPGHPMAGENRPWSSEWVNSSNPGTTGSVGRWCPSTRIRRKAVLASTSATRRWRGLRYWRPPPGPHITFRWLPPCSCLGERFSRFMLDLAADRPLHGRWKGLRLCFASPLQSPSA